MWYEKYRVDHKKFATDRGHEGAVEGATQNGARLAFSISEGC